MARPTLVLDASVGVKWFSARGEADLTQALAIRDAHVSRQTIVVVPDLFYYEVANAIAHKNSIPARDVQEAVVALFGLHLATASVDPEILSASARLARQFSVTIYDACYIAVAQKHGCPLVTANPRHQGKSLDCKVIPIGDWKE